MKRINKDYTFRLQAVSAKVQVSYEDKQVVTDENASATPSVEKV